MTKDEALKKAFKQAFQLGQDYWYQADHEFESQNKKSDVTRAKFEQLMEDAIKEALAQPEQEPVGEIVDAIEGAFKCSFTKMLPVGTKLYTTPPQRKPLTDEEIQHLLMPVRISGDGYYLRIARAIEAAHGIKGEA